MIKINDRFSIDSDSLNWILIEYSDGKDKDGNETITNKKTYHADIKQIAYNILNKSTRDCDSLIDIIDIFDDAVEKLAIYIEECVDEIRK